MSAWTGQVANLRLITWGSSAPATSPMMETSGSPPEPTELQGGTDLAHKVRFSLQVLPWETGRETAKNNRMSEKLGFLRALCYANQIPWLNALMCLPTNPTRLARRRWALRHNDRRRCFSLAAETWLPLNVIDMGFIFSVFFSVASMRRSYDIIVTHIVLMWTEMECVGKESPLSLYKQAIIILNSSGRMWCFFLTHTITSFLLERTKTKVPPFPQYSMVLPQSVCFSASCCSTATTDVWADDITHLDPWLFHLTSTIQGI